MESELGNGKVQMFVDYLIFRREYKGKKKKKNRRQTIKDALK